MNYRWFGKTWETWNGETWEDFLVAHLVHFKDPECDLNPVHDFGCEYES